MLLKNVILIRKAKIVLVRTKVDALGHVMEERGALGPLNWGQSQGGDHHSHYQESQERGKEARRNPQPRPE